MRTSGRIRDSIVMFQTSSMVPRTFRRNPNSVGDAVPDAILRKMLPTKPQQEEDLNKSLIEKAADTAAVGAAIGPFLVKHREAVAFPKIKEFLTHLRADPEHKKIGSVGFCWGGRYSILLAHAGAEPYVDGAVAFHPSFLSIPDEIEKIERPVDIEVGDQDALVKASDIETIQGIFHNKPQCHIEVHPDQVHGFSVRGDLSIEKDKKAKEKGNENVRNQNTCTNFRLLTSSTKPCPEPGWRI